ncbi:putative transcription factor C2H2 family [Medicago truncatula]|uniref:IBR domain protein n=1 Tax=Medicago truncatula TaxID=3880 RepID=G7K6G6_MEDTR|nr:IBR domain protein [Medicago truncatula]RHN53400.1 putative transcription factor C2H2 family [Medicago truncatula]
MRFLRSIKQAANKYVTQVEDLLWSHDDEEKEENSEISLSDDVWVICPFNDCSILMSFDGLEIVTKAECPSCHMLFCVQCKVPWHEGLNCQQFQRKLACSNKTYMIVDSQNTVPKKRSSPFEGRDNDEKKKAKKKDAIAVDSNQASYQNLVKVNCNEFQQQKSKEKATVESGRKCSSQSPKSKSICDLCYDIVPDANIVRGSTICNHQFCANCISKHVAEQLSQNIKKICCPNPVCSVELKPQYLQHILPKEVVGRWEYESYMAWWNRDFK